MRSFILVGTDTNVGKTVVSGWVLAHMPYMYWKPVASGVKTDDDSLTAAHLSQCGPACIVPSTYRLKAPLSPHWAAEQEGITIDVNRLTLPSQKPLLIEGAGGILTPLTHQATFLDWIKSTHLPVIIVARDHMGTINHTGLTIRALKQENVPILGVIMSTGEDCSPDERHGPTIRHFNQVPILAELPHLNPLTPERLKATPIPSTLAEALS